MLETIVALVCRILSNPVANALQKQLVQKKSAILINWYSYLFLSLFCLLVSINSSSNIQIVKEFLTYGLDFWFYVALAGILCTLGSICLIKALQIGDMSVLGPINSYKSIVGLVFGVILLGEIPSITGLAGVLLIIAGSWFIFDTVDEGFSFKLFLRKDIILRFCALFFTGCEAAVLKKIILMSSVWESFILWCFSGFIFTLLIFLVFNVKIQLLTKKELIKCFFIALCLGVMQFSTNFDFEKMNVGLALALFQLSTLVHVILWYKIFQEQQILKKVLGSIIMIAGTCLILLF